MARLIGIDIGGTWVKYGLVNRSNGKIERQGRFPTPKSEKALFSQLAKAAKNLSEGQKVDGVGIATPGIFDGDLVTALADNLSFKKLNVVRRARAALSEEGVNAPVKVTNDAKAAGLGILHFGNYPENKIIVLSLGTGIGATFVDKDPSLPQPYIKPMEPGQTIVGVNSPHRIETMAGSAAIIRQVASKHHSVSDLRDVIRLDESGDRHTAKVRESAGKQIAFLLYNLTHSHQNNSFVLAGGMRNWQGLVKSINHHYGENFARTRSPIPKAAIHVTPHDELGVMGAAAQFK